MANRRRGATDRPATARATDDIGDETKPAVRGKAPAGDGKSDSTASVPGEAETAAAEAADRTSRIVGAIPTAEAETMRESADGDRSDNGDDKSTDQTGTTRESATGERARRSRAGTDGDRSRWKAGRNHPVIGLTGPMCAGKNVAGALLEARGFAVVDADKVAHAALIDVQSKVIEEFRCLAHAQGIALVAADGSLDRRALGALVFSDPDLLARHESLVYPRINELLEDFIEKNPDRPVVINAPLLHKSPVLDRCDFVIFVDAWAAIRLFRARNRDKLPFSQISARFSAQKHLFAQYLSKDVDIQRVWNHGSARVLARKLMKLLSDRGY